MEDIAIIACIFGTEFNKVYMAPLPGQSYFYTNNKGLEKEITSKGWIYEYIDEPLCNDSFINSMLSKKVKFLQIRPKNYRYILGVDHKLKVTKNIVEFVYNLRDNPVVIRRSPALKTSVWTEFNIAKGHPRYSRTGQQLKAYVDNKLRNGFTAQTVICATGFILWDTANNKAMELAENMYRAVQEANNPECQVLWGLWSQKYKDIIKVQPWTAPTIVWQTPK